MYLFRLVYYSRTVLPEDNDEATQSVKQILEASQKNNPQAGITGSLLFDMNYFAQILEGDRKAVTSTYNRICSDSRHNNLVIMDARPVDQRLFGRWSMGYAKHQNELNDLYVKYGSSTSFNPAKMTADSLLSLVRELSAAEDGKFRFSTHAMR